MSLAFTLRPLQPGDMPALTGMWVESWNAVFPQIDFEARRSWFGARMAAHCASGALVIVAQGEADLLGFITLDAVTGFIDQLAVARVALGQGIAQALLARARAASPLRLLLDVNAANLRAVRFYARQGFVVAGDGVNAASGMPLLRMHWPGDFGQQGADFPTHPVAST